MSLPKKKRRSITINDERFYWLVGRQRFDFFKRTDISVAPFALLRLNIVIESSISGARIVAEFHGLFALAVPSLGFLDAQDIVITPKIIKNIIEYAQIKRSWKPQIKDSELIINHAQSIFPEAIWSGFKEIDLGYDANKINEYLKDAVRIWLE